MKFVDLTQQDKIQYVKDNFVLILEQLAGDPTKIKNYVKVPEKSKTVLPVLERVEDTMTDEEKVVVLERNKQANEHAAKENERLELEYNTAQAALKKVEQVLFTLKIKPC